MENAGKTLRRNSSRRRFQNWMPLLAFAALFLVVGANGRGLAQVANESRPSAAEAASESGTPAATDAGGAARAKLLADTHRLLTLTRELKAEAARSTPNTLSLSLVKKSEEIQKLAAVVKAEMAKVP